MRNRPEILARAVLLPTGYEFNFGPGDDTRRGIQSVC
jgi:hypothetical protein